MTVNLITGDARAVLATLPDETVQCVVTSPPYWGLRDYDVAGQLGLERTPEEYIERLVAIMREVRRVLRSDGTLWLNLGDSYANDGKWGGATSGKHVQELHGSSGVGRSKRETGLKPKDLVGIPWRVAFALQADGWHLRSDVIWHKPNPMPESVMDRPTKAHEYLFLLSKSPRYYYDLDSIKESVTGNAHPSGKGRGKKLAQPGQGIRMNASFTSAIRNATKGDCPTSRNRRSVWTIPTKPYRAAHFATFPPALVEPCIKAGTSEWGCCPDCGAPWVRVLGGRVPVEGRSSGNLVRKVSGEQDNGRLATHMGSSVPWSPTTANTLGWRPGCGHYARADDWVELIKGELTPDDESENERRTTLRTELLALFATYRVIPCAVLDPFSGAGTTALVASRLGRDAIGIDLNPDYTEMARERLAKGLPPLLQTGGDDMQETAGSWTA